MKRYWNWLIPNRRQKILTKTFKQNQELGLYDKPIILIQELIEVFKAHRRTSFEKMKEHKQDFQFYEGRADAFKLAIYILELKEEELKDEELIFHMGISSLDEY